MVSDSALVMDISGGASSTVGVGNVFFKREISAGLFEKIDLSKYALTRAEVHQKSFSFSFHFIS